jgi:hypothetical protein
LIRVYDPIEHQPLAARDGVEDVRVRTLSYRALALWMLGDPDAARADIEFALKDARAIGHAATLMTALSIACPLHICCRDDATLNAVFDELVTLADEKSAAPY